jgi:LacI family transcriptional regulator
MASNSSSRVKPNIRMVAELARVSATTASLALRGDTSIPRGTRERVLVAARELNYIHTPRRSRPEQANPCQLVFVTADQGDYPVTANPFYGEVLTGAERECGECNASLTFTIMPHGFAKQPPLPSALRDPDLDGLLLVGAYAPSVVERIVAEVKRPLVLVDNTVPGQPYDSVMADDFGGGFLATQHLLGLGHRDIAMVVGTMAAPSLAERYRGYHSACRKAGVQPGDPIEVVWERPAIAAMLDQVWAQTPQPTAFFCAQDAYAAFLMELLRDGGRSVPDDISVVGFDDLAPMRLVRPALTTIHNHPRTLGRIGVQRLMARINGDQQPSQGIMVGTNLVIRDSTRRR